MITKDWTDERGVKRRSYVINEYDTPDHGMPADVFDDLDILYEDTSQAFRVTLYNRLWELGLIEVTHYNSKQAMSKYRQALQYAIRHDASDAIRQIRTLDLETI